MTRGPRVCFGVSCLLLMMQRLVVLRLLGSLLLSSTATMLPGSVSSCLVPQEMLLRAFWRETLSGAPSMIQLPQDRPRPSKPTFAAGVTRLSLPDGLLPRLEGVARSLRVNAQAVLLAALQAVLLRYTGQDDLVVGVPVAGRDRQETHGLVGYFINTLPVRCLASEGASFADMVRGASTATLAALDHALLPLEEVIAVAGVARVPNANPLFQVLFQYLPEGAGRGDVAAGWWQQPSHMKGGRAEPCQAGFVIHRWRQHHRGRVHG